MKKCRKCSENKELSEYYRHSQMFDRRLNICKECTKKRVSTHRKENIDKIREYDRNRPNAKDRNKEHLERMKNLSDAKKKAYRKVKTKGQQSGFSKNKKIANIYMDNAVRGGRLEKLDYCEHCSREDIPLDGHHPDYLKPLEVIWLCKPCHGAEHKRLNAIKRERQHA